MTSLKSETFRYLQVLYMKYVLRLAVNYCTFTYSAQGANHFKKSKGVLIHFECPAQIVNSPAAISVTCNYFF